MEFLKRLYRDYICTHSDTTSLTYYRVTCFLTPTIKVFTRTTCKKCGHVEETLVSEYPNCYYNLSAVRQNLEAKGIQNLENLLVRETNLVAEKRHFSDATDINATSLLQYDVKTGG